MSSIRRRIAGAVLAASVVGSGLAVAAAPQAHAGDPGGGHCRYSYAQPVLHYGATGPSVRQAQCLLFMAGYSISADSSFGPATLRTVKTFQGRHGLERDGIIGPHTWAALYRYN